MLPPPTVAEPSFAEQSRRPIHILDPEARIHLAGGLLSIERPGKEPLRLRLPEIGSLSIHGRASLSTPCLHALLAEGIPILWRSAGGYLLGHTLGLGGRGAAARRAQYGAAGSALGLEIARRLVGGKLANMRALLRRRGPDPRIEAAGRAIGALAPRLAGSAALPALLGLEGAATAAYFASWPAMLRTPAMARHFTGRNRRPPRDPVNAALSYAYAVLTGECAAAVVATGLDPTDGFLHAAVPGRPALALDLMEPFRPLIADSAVLFALNTEAVTEADFAAETDGWRLSERGRKLLLETLWRRLEQRFVAGDGRETSYREAIGALAQGVAHALATGTAAELAVPTRR